MTLNLISSESTLFNAAYPKIEHNYGQSADQVADSIYLEARTNSSLGCFFSVFAWLSGFHSRAQAAAQKAFNLHKFVNFNANFFNTAEVAPHLPKNPTHYQMWSAWQSHKKTTDAYWKTLHSSYKKQLQSQSLPNASNSPRPASSPDSSALHRSASNSRTDHSLRETSTTPSHETSTTQAPARSSSPASAPQVESDDDDVFVPPSLRSALPLPTPPQPAQRKSPTELPMGPTDPVVRELGKLKNMQIPNEHSIPQFRDNLQKTLPKLWKEIILANGLADVETLSSETTEPNYQALLKQLQKKYDDPHEDVALLHEGAITIDVFADLIRQCKGDMQTLHDRLLFFYYRSKVVPLLKEAGLSEEAIYQLFDQVKAELLIQQPGLKDFQLLAEGMKWMHDSFVGFQTHCKSLYDELKKNSIRDWVSRTKGLSDGKILLLVLRARILALKEDSTLRNRPLEKHLESTSRQIQKYRHLFNTAFRGQVDRPDMQRHIQKIVQSAKAISENPNSINELLSLALYLDREDLRNADSRLFYPLLSPEMIECLETPVLTNCVSPPHSKRPLSVFVFEYFFPDEYKSLTDKKGLYKLEDALLEEAIKSTLLEDVSAFNSPSPTHYQEQLPKDLRNLGSTWRGISLDKSIKQQQAKNKEEERLAAARHLAQSLRTPEVVQAITNPGPIKPLPESASSQVTIVDIVDIVD